MSCPNPRAPLPRVSCTSTRLSCPGAPARIRLQTQSCGNHCKGWVPFPCVTFSQDRQSQMQIAPEVHEAGGHLRQGGAGGRSPPRHKQDAACACNQWPVSGGLSVGSITRESATGRAPGSPRMGGNQSSSRSRQRGEGPGIKCPKNASRLQSHTARKLDCLNGHSTMAHLLVRNTARRPPRLTATKTRKLDCPKGHGLMARRPTAP